jgi:hypothetical protein
MAKREMEFISARDPRGVTMDLRLSSAEPVALLEVRKKGIHRHFDPVQAATTASMDNTILKINSIFFNTPSPPLGQYSKDRAFPSQTERKSAESARGRPYEMSGFE